MKVKVSKISDNVNTFSTELEKLNNMPFVPAIGKCLVLNSTQEMFQGISTSTVVEYTENKDQFIVKTRNSTYQIDKVVD